MKLNVRRALDWCPPKGWVTVRSIDAHTAGEPLRVILVGWPDLRGETILDRRRDARQRDDSLRTSLMWEPRGHADMYGCIVTPPVTADADFGVLFLHNEGFSTMCGHGIIGVTTVVLETGVLRADGPETTVRIDTPAGLVTARALIEDGRVRNVAFTNVPSFVLHRDRRVEVAGIGPVHYDLAFGGAFYAFVDAAATGVSLEPGGVQELICKGTAIKGAVAGDCAIEHPYERDLGFLYGTIFSGPPLAPDADARNVCVFAAGEVDRSPTGTGVSARAALEVARGDMRIGDSMVVESVIGSRFRVTAKDETDYGPHRAIVPEVEGEAYITGRHEFFVDPADPLGDGFILR